MFFFFFLFFSFHFLLSLQFFFFFPFFNMSNNQVFKIAFSAKAGQGGNRISVQDPFLNHLKWEVSCFTDPQNPESTSVHLGVHASPHVKVDLARFQLRVTKIAGHEVDMQPEGEDDPEEFSIAADATSTFNFVTHAKKADDIEVTVTYLQLPILTL